MVSEGKSRGERGEPDTFLLYYGDRVSSGDREEGRDCPVIPHVLLCLWGLLGIRPTLTLLLVPPTEILTVTVRVLVDTGVTIPRDHVNFRTRSFGVERVFRTYVMDPSIVR